MIKKEFENTAAKRSSCITIIRNTMKSHFLLGIVIVLLLILTVGLSAFSPILYKILIDDVIPEGSLFQICFFVILLILIPIAVMLLSFLKDRFVYDFSNLISEELRRKAYSSALNMTYKDFGKIGYQNIMKAITREAGRICDVFLFGDVISVVNSILVLVVTFTILAKLNWILAVVSLVMFPILFLVINKSKSNVSNLESQLAKLLSRCDNYLTHALLGIKTVKAFHGQTYETEEFDDWLKDNKALNWKIKSTHTFTRTVLPSSVQQIAFGVILVLCAYLVMKGQMTMGTLLAGVSYVPILFSSISSLLGTRIGYESVKNSIYALDEILNSEQEQGTIIAIEDGPIAIEINNLDFAYDREDFHIHIEQLSLKPGEMLAVVGESGSGKSALFDVLCGFYRINSGSVRIFGKEIGDIQPDILRQIVRLTSQNVILWNKTIEENIIYPIRKDEKNDEKYKESIKRAGLRSFIDSLEQGDQTVLGDFGSQISGGEKQRIAFARSLYSEFKILLLDEPTAALDSIHAKIVFDTLLEEKKKGKTIIVVTHDIFKAMQADTIAVMKDGNIVECGAPKQLLLEGDQFKKLYESFDMENGEKVTNHGKIKIPERAGLYI